MEGALRHDHGRTPAGIVQGLRTNTGGQDIQAGVGVDIEYDPVAHLISCDAGQQKVVITCVQRDVEPHRWTVPGDQLVCVETKGDLRPKGVALEQQ